MQHLQRDPRILERRRDVREPYVRATAMTGFAAAAQAAGGDPAVLLAEVGLPQSALYDFDGLISLPRFCALLELASQRLDSPCFGLNLVLGSADSFPHVGPLIHLAHFVDTLREWIETGVSYWRVHCNGAILQPVENEDADTVSLRCYYPYFEGEPVQFTDRLLALIFMIARRVSPGIERPMIVRLRRDAPPDLSFHRKAFKEGVEFAAKHSELVLTRSFLEIPVRGDLKAFRPLVNGYIRAKIRRMPDSDQSLAATVAIAITTVFGSKRCSVEFVAQSLGWSAKKLQRQLAVEGTSFSQLLEDVRERNARRLLSDSDVPVATVAELLDYSATAPFTTAFKRWTGQSPLDYRKRARDPAAED